jgi:5S rRNA maturation endonuclease (ribonuclease M5)
MKTVTSKPELKTSPKVLIVEGYSDLTFYAEFLEHLGRHAGVFIKDIGGSGNRLTALETFLNPALIASKSHIAIMLDADANGEGIASGLQNKIRDMTKRELTESLWSESSTGDAKLGFFIAPSPQEVGEIEDLVWRSIREDAAHAPKVRCVDDFISCMGASATSEKSRIAKRHLGSWLSIHCEDDPRLGSAARSRKINFEAPALARLKDFLSGF